MAPHYRGSMMGKKQAASRRPKKAAKAGASRGTPLRIKSWSAAEVEEAFSRFSRADPEPKGELQHRDPYTLLVAVVLSAQATDAGVNKATPGLFAAADSPAPMVPLGEERLRELIKTIGLYRN